MPHPSLVSHRGLHFPGDSTERPVENTVAAYRGAWEDLGYTHCECDVALSSDGVLFLCHDTTFKRLSKSRISTPVSELSWDKDLKTLELVDGSRPATLEEVLELARDVEGEKYLVVELKPDHESEERRKKTVDALADFFNDKRPDLLEFVSVFMSFQRSLVVESKSKIKSPPKRVKFLFLTVVPVAKMVDNKVAAIDASSPTFHEDFKTLAKGLDGLYAMYQSAMITSKFLGPPKGFVMGVWGLHPLHPDGFHVVEALDEKGVHFVNTDVPEGTPGAEPEPKRRKRRKA